MMMGEREEDGWSMRQGKRKMMGKEGEEDRLVCVRFMTVDREIKLLKLKIPGILIRKLEAAHRPPTPPEIISKRTRTTTITTRSSSSSTTCADDDDSGSRPHHHDPDDVEHELADECSIDKVVSQRHLNCKVDPKLNGPFTIPFPQEYISRHARWACIGSVMYSLGGYKDHFDPEACAQLVRELSGFHPTMLGLIPTPIEPIIRPLTTGGTDCRATSPPPTPPPSSDNNVCHYFHYCDMSKPDPQWHVSNKPLTSPRLAPILVSLESMNMLFAFGGNCPTDGDAPFAEVFDFSKEFWEPLPPPPFDRLAAWELYAFPLPMSCSEILVLGVRSRIRYIFDASTWCWRPHKGEGKGKTNKYRVIDTSYLRMTTRLHVKPVKPVLSEFDGAFYWINRAGRLAVYTVMGDRDRDEFKYYEGYVPALKHEWGGGLLKALSLALLPLSQHLVALLWYSNHDHLYSRAFLHLTILSVSFLPPDYYHDRPHHEGPKVNLTASALACLSFRLEGDTICRVIDAYLM